MQFNKIPKTSYAMQQEMVELFSQGIGSEIIQTLEPIVLIQISMREPINSQLPIFYLCTQSFNYSKSWVRQLMHWKWRGMAANFIYDKT